MNIYFLARHSAKVLVGSKAKNVGASEATPHFDTEVKSSNNTLLLFFCILFPEYYGK
jgi:hypothetical protein